MDLRTRLAQLETRLGVRRREEPVPSLGGHTSVALSARLQRLVSAQTDMPPRRAVSQGELANLLGGTLCADGVVMIEHVLPTSHFHGRVCFRDLHAVALDFLAGGVAPASGRLLFVDTETTGLAGGTGTVAFVLGLARVRDDVVQVRQYFLAGFHAEHAMLMHALAWINDASHLVSFNGKCFDVPLLVTRYRMARMESPLSRLAHVDLLHPTRAAFRHSWPDCRLQTAEQYLLQLHRHDDTPGYLIPQIWSDLLRGGETRGLRGIIEHNRTDVLSLIALATVLAQTYAHPGQRHADPLAIARAHRRAGDASMALVHLRDHGDVLTEEAQLELATLYARSGQWEEAVALWETLAARDVVPAMERLAMYCEHRQRDFAAALHWTERLLALCEDCSAGEKRRSRLLARSQRSSRAREAITPSSRIGEVATEVHSDALHHAIPSGIAVEPNSSILFLVQTHRWHLDGREPRHVAARNVCARRCDGRTVKAATAAFRLALIGGSSGRLARRPSGAAQG